MKRKRQVVKTGVAASDAVTPPPARVVDPRIVVAQAVAIVAVVLWIYWPALHGLWLWDDLLLISDNSLVHDSGGWWKIWLEPVKLFDFQPIEVSALWLEWHLWGDHTTGYHVVNILLHILGAMLVWRLLDKLGLRFAWLGGMLFAVHPVMVESVAWMAELKNTLSLPLFLLAMCAYVDYDARGKRADYLSALGFYIAAMLCKTSMAMFPFIILLYAWYRRDRIHITDVKASAPFFLVSLVVGSLAVWFLQRAATSLGMEMGDQPPGGFIDRLFFAGSILSFYFFKSVVPIGLLTIYPRWTLDYSSLPTWSAWGAVLGAVLVCWLKRNSWGRPMLLGLGFFMINLAPFLGLNAGPYMGFSWVMDHILYLPIIGLIGLAAGGAEIMAAHSPMARECTKGTAVLLLGAMAFASHNYATLYRHPRPLFVYNVEHNPDAWPAQNNLGAVLLDEHDYPGAAAHFRKTIELCPTYARAYASLGLALSQMGKMNDAVVELQKSVQLNSTSAFAYRNLGAALADTGRLDEAIDAFQSALRINPDNRDARYNLAMVLARKGKLSDAIDQCRAIVATNPDDVGARWKLAEYLMQAGKTDEAVTQYDAALKNDPHYQDYRAKLKQLQDTKAPVH